ncbi:hypothetical protein C789_352 [Microcystis aeruginosa FACHB-905 = DIANCHI905]|uniref:Uncharacterized protein n=1 Tax=Microcystis aeruginosa PCC 7806SL TaxID=1903187 RepID=A0AB33BPK4_MICA7|nr:hypothetical protein BH695_1747 [Microcystis aeruginosa PCC 7806SL]ELS49826.1 hypothetical protein C789_352 [Microcystis aeruginosa FACHB-905 = DIANCHI905]
MRIWVTSWGKTGIYLVTKGSTQANIKVAIEWEFNQDKGG